MKNNSNLESNHHQQKLKSTMYVKDWRTALRSPPPYRIGGRPFRFNVHILIISVAAVLLVFLFLFSNSGSRSSSDFSRKPSISLWSSYFYNDKYPLTQPLLLDGTYTYRIGMVADMDTHSKVGSTDMWRSYLMKGFLRYNPDTRYVAITWDTTEPVVLESGYSTKGRGMELSELVTFNGKQYSVEDRTGIIYEVDMRSNKVIPWVVLMDGNGHNTKGFKSEWATVKDRTLYVGSIGKEWTTDNGDYSHNNPMYVKAISPSGEVKSLDWTENYKNIRKSSAQIEWPGYMIHESGVWSDVHKKWFFLPRRCSNEKYNSTKDEFKGCDLLISTDERFSQIKAIKVENKEKSHGFSSFKFIPGSNDKAIVAIKSEEVNDKTSTFITAFTIDGDIILDESKIPTNLKYEGIEFI